MALSVSTIYLYPEQNAQRHHTDNFELVQLEKHPIPVIRRGQSFNVAVRFIERDFVLGKDTLKVMLSLGNKPNTIKGTKGVIFVSTDARMALDVGKWGGKIVRNEDRTVTLELMTPSSTPFGSWSLEILVNNQELVSYDGDLWILFNPWRKHDLVHMPEEKLLDEYVLADVGKIWTGSDKVNQGRHWIFGQFDDCILPGVALMLERAKVAYENRGDPIEISRAFSRIINYNDDDGVLVGRWDGDYAPHTNPSAWTGSIDIIEKFLDTKKPVMYGQCWVFAGVLTTACRAIGIPSRVVSNMISAHDANQTLTIDKFYDLNMDEVEDDPLNSTEANDSIWNYHVWNDVYMARPDLPIGYGGWQAVDATPQETSNGFYQCGPASLVAIREGAVGLNYDVQFVLSSVNADMVMWQIDETNPLGFKRISSDKNHVGKMVLTKKPLVYDPKHDTDVENVTDQYKPPEGSKDNRLALLNAVRNTSRAKRFYEVPEETVNDIEFSIEDLETVDLGKPFVVVVKAKNNSSEVRHIDAVLSAQSVYYNGVKANVLKKSAGMVAVDPKSDKEIRMTVPPSDYVSGIVEYALVKMNAICTVQETQQVWSGDDDFQLLTPSIKVDIKKQFKVGETVNVGLSLSNPLDFPLANCSFYLSGPGLIKRTVKIPFRDMKGLETISVSVPVTGNLKGEFKLVSTFTSTQLSDITGSASVSVV